MNSVQANQALQIIEDVIVASAPRLADHLNPHLSQDAQELVMRILAHHVRVTLCEHDKFRDLMFTTDPTGRKDRLAQSEAIVNALEELKAHHGTPETQEVLTHTHNYVKASLLHIRFLTHERG